MFINDNNNNFLYICWADGAFFCNNCTTTNNNFEETYNKLNIIIIFIKILNTIYYTFNNLVACIYI